MILRTSISFIACFLLSWVVAAQHNSMGSRFQTDVIKGCQPLTVTIDAPYCNGQPCTIDYDEGAGYVQYTNVKTFNEPGIYKMHILFGSTGADTIRIEVTPNIPPAFDLYTCGNGTVVTKITDTNYYDEYVVAYSDGSPDDIVTKGISTPHAFGISGTQTVSVRGRKKLADNYEDNCTPTVKNIDTSAPIGPATFNELEVTTPAQLELNLTGSAITLYKLQIGVNSAGTWNNYRDVFETNTVTVDNIQPDNNFYCFRIGMFNPCSNAVVGYSDVICSADFDAQAQSDANRLAWRTATNGIGDYTINKKDPDRSLSPLTEAPPTAQTLDMDVICKTDYTYQLVSNYANGSRSLSLPKTVTAFSTRQPTAPQNISTQVQEGNNAVLLTWDQDAGFRPDTYTITKLTNGSPAGTSESKTTTYTDGQYDPSIPTCYTISYKDLCDNASPVSHPACPVQLTGAVQNDNKIVLTWSPYTGWTVGVNRYTILKYDADGNLLETINTGSTSYTDAAEDFEHQVYRYVIQATPNGVGIQPSVSNTVQETKSPNLVYPSAFTPNGDGLNDRFIVFGRYVTGFEMSIFNRWGELLFSTGDLADGWDGTYHGNPMPEGTYVFRAKITDMTGKTYDRSGSVLLLRRRE